MILATKGGWLIACEVISETSKTTIVKPFDSGYEREVSKSSKTEKLFDDVYEAQDWIMEK